MADLDKALADLDTIRAQMAAGTLFQGFGPLVMAITGAVAIATGFAQSLWPDVLAATPFGYFLTWIVTAIFCVGIIGLEMFARSRRHHGGLADAMILKAIEQYVHAGLVGAALGFVLLRFAPEAMWLLPGLWQIFVGLAIFASLRTMPRALAIAGGFYLIAGITGITIASLGTARAAFADPTIAFVFSPWFMALPFGIGQAIIGFVLYTASEIER